VIANGLPVAYRTDVRFGLVRGSRVEQMFGLSLSTGCLGVVHRVVDRQSTHIRLTTRQNARERLLIGNLTPQKSTKWVVNAGVIVDNTRK